MKIIFGRLNLWLFLIIFSSLCKVLLAWHWIDYLGDPIGLSTTTLTMDQVSELRVRDIKRRLSRNHGYGAEELGRILDKKELVQMLAFEEHKVHLKEVEAARRDMFWKALMISLLIGLITLFWPLLRHLYEVASVNFVVYTDRKRYEAKRCWDYRSVDGCIGVCLMAALDLVQVWLTISVLLSWFIKSKYFFPMPSIPIHPAALVGGPISQGPLARYGINVAPMAISWALRFVHSRLENVVGHAMKRAYTRQRKQQREQETPEERAARKAVKRFAREQRQQQQQDIVHADEPHVRPLTVEEIRQAAAEAAERRRANLDSNTAFDDLD